MRQNIALWVAGALFVLVRRWIYVKSLFYSWTVFQLLVGIWLFISPFVFGYGDTPIATNNMIFGAIVVILGVGTVFYEAYHRERYESLPGMEHAKEKA